MNKSNIFVSGAIGIFSFFVVKVFLDLGILLSLLVGLAVGGGLIIVLIARSRGETSSNVAKEVVKQAMQPDPGADERRVYEQLTRFNEQIRLAILDNVVMLSCEELMDLLLDLVPHAQEKSPGTETTFDLEQLATTHLPRLMKEFADLGPSDRAAQQEALLRQLQGLKEKMTALKRHLVAGELHEFQVEHGFLNQKF